MQIKKFISFDAASKDLWVLNTDQLYYNQVRQFVNLWHRLIPQCQKHTIEKYKSIEEAGRARWKKAE